MHLPSAARWIMRSSANSAQMVLPEPVGAATSALSSVLYSAVKTWREGEGEWQHDGQTHEATIGRQECVIPGCPRAATPT